MREIKRDNYLEILKKSLTNSKITFLIGARQVGKTTLLKQFSRELENYAFVPCDKLSLKKFESAEDLLNAISLNQGVDFQKMNYLILDEIQMIENISIFLKDLHDNFNLKIFASGSGSLEIFRGISDSLVGRKEIINIYPLSFYEFLQSKNTPIIPPKKATRSVMDTYLVFLEEYLSFGGYPEVVLAKGKTEKMKVLLSIYRSYIEKDIKEYLQSGDVFSFEKFYKLIAASICSLQKIDNICKEISVYREKVEKFSFILKNTFIMDLVDPWVSNTAKEIKSHKKIYFSDTGFMNSSLESFLISKDRQGKLIENFVLSELRKSISKKELSEILKIYFWRKKSQTEIDFVIKNLKNGKLIPIEVKSKSTDVIPKSFKSFLDLYESQTDFFVVLNKDVSKERMIKGKRVLFLPYFYAESVIKV